MSRETLINARDVAQLLGMSVDYVWTLCRRGEIPHQRFGKKLRFRPSAIEEWLREREHGSMRR